MANIQPYDYQKRTNIEEHNDLVSKINEIIDVINQTNIETIMPKINKLETDVSAINDTDNVQNTDISNLKEKDVQIENRLGIDEGNIDDITKSLVSDVVLMNGTTTGNMKARIGRENAPSIDSNDYNIQKPVSVELVQGSASAMVKAKITLSDGTVLISDDFMFTTEAIGTDVYISSFTFKNGNVAGTISADIGLSNGSTLEANNFVVPTDPNVISTISDLQSRMTAVESGVGSITDLKTTVDGHTTSINELNTDVANLKTDKADVNNNNQIITAGTINANNINKGGVAVATVNDIPDISGKVNIAQGTENAGKSLIVGEDGNVTVGDLPSPSLFDCGPVMVSIPILKTLFSEPSSVGVYPLIFGISAIRNNTTSPSSLIKRFVGFTTDASSTSKNTYHATYTSDIAITIAKAINLKQFGVHTYEVKLYSGVDSGMSGFSATLTINWNGTSYSYTNSASNILITSPNSYSVDEYDSEHYLVTFGISSVTITA